MENLITSTQNPKIKYAVKLRENKERHKSGLIIIEGFRELSLALESNVKIDTLFYCSQFASEANIFPPSVDKNIIIKTSEKIFKKIAYREHPDGFLAIAHTPFCSLKNIKLSPRPIVIIIEAIEKPGNLGAILRSADAAGADAVIMADPKTDIYNPNVIRASQGTVFTNQITTAYPEEIKTWLQKNKIISFAATPSAKKIYTTADYKKPCAILVGTEDTGLSDFWLENATEKIKIKMRGKIDSLNVSVSTAIILFEAIRQRNID